MARFARRTSDVYVGMLALSALATALGIGLLVLELESYDWVTAPSGPKLTAPALPPEEPVAASTPAN